MKEQDRPPVNLESFQKSSSAHLEDLNHSEAERLVKILDDYVESLKQGLAPSRAELMARHPDLSSQLDACLTGIEFIHRRVRGDDIPKQLGDFKIVREIGRGGMGAVYEAEQVSLGRTVALKVLHIGPLADSQSLSRFQREVETVGSLHHTHIVPVFAVGSQDGISFYAMQYIPGKSLDQLLRAHPEGLDLAQVLTWTMAIADALHYAHQRGVIHRDIKPSNLIVDEQGEVWLTDFGLAKRLNDPTLSVTGSLLGTPRYMSPEQAATQHQWVDQRTDIYSLGATLYELLTGQPLFDADSPMAVVGQILTEEPIEPRRINRELPERVEAIILKCLAKEPDDRYPNAARLSCDLAAALNEQSTEAQPASNWQRLKKRFVPKPIGWAAMSLAALTLVAATLIVVIPWFLQSKRPGRFHLATNESDLTAKVIDVESDPQPQSSMLPTEEPLQLSPGMHDLLVEHPSKLGQVYRIRATANDSKMLKLGLDDTLIEEDVVPESSRLVRLGDHAAIVCFDGSGIRWRRMGAKTSMWRSLEPSIRKARPSSSSRNVTQLLTSIQFFPHIQSSPTPWIVGQIPWIGTRPKPTDDATSIHLLRADGQRAPDLDQDGAADLVIADYRSAWIAAYSQQSGKLLWIHRRFDIHPSGASPRRSDLETGILYEPICVPDQDGDGITDLLITVFGGSEWPSAVAPQYGLELISGATGKSIWKRQLPSALTVSEPGFARLHTPTPPSRLSNVGNVRLDKSQPEFARRTTHRAYCRQVVISEPVITHQADNASAQIHLHCGTSYLALDLATGDPTGSPIDVGIFNLVQPSWADFDGDQALDVLLLSSSFTNTPSRPSVSPDSFQAVVWSPSRGQAIWQRKILATHPALLGPHRASWPSIIDVDEDGSPEVILPNLNQSSPGMEDSLSIPPWGVLECLSGIDGKSLWRSRIFSLDQQPDCFCAGPDITGDGVPDLFVASLWGMHTRLFLEALDGTSGKQLWWNQSELEHDVSSQACQLFVPTIVAGIDEQLALFVVPVGEKLLQFSTIDGRLKQTLPRPKTNLVWIADIDRDRKPELIGHQPHIEKSQLLISAQAISLSALRFPCYCRASDGRPVNLLAQTSIDARDKLKQLQVIQSGTDEIYRGVAEPSRPFTDLNQDGMADFVGLEDQRVVAICGTTGSIIWRSPALSSDDALRLKLLNELHLDSFARPPNIGMQDFDLDDDGVADVIVGREFHGSQPAAPIVALSGRTGDVLWTDPRKTDVAVEYLWCEPTDLDDDGRRELICVAGVGLRAERETGSKKPNHLFRVNVACFSARGTLLWEQNVSRLYSAPLSEETVEKLRTGHQGTESFPLLIDDFNQDGCLDVFVLGDELAGPFWNNVKPYAFDGRRGEPIWDTKPGPEWRSSNNTVQLVRSHEHGNELSLIVSRASHNSDPELNTDALEFYRYSSKTGSLLDRWTLPNFEPRGSRIAAAYRFSPRGVGRIRTAQGVSLMAWHYGSSQTLWLTVMDLSGNAISSTPLSDFALDKVTPESARYWISDVDGDGIDELIHHVRGVWECCSPLTPNQPRWQRTHDHPMQERFIAMTENEGDLGELIVRSDRAACEVLAIDVKNGKTVWRCVGPRLSGELDSSECHAVVPNADVNSLPAVIFDTSQMRLIRRAQPTLYGLSLEPNMKHVQNLVTKRGGVDPRRLRPLPWVPQGNIPAEYGQPGFLGYLFVSSLVLCLAPFVFIIRFISSQAVTLRSILVLTAWVGLVILLVSKVPVPWPSVTEVSERLVHALIAFPGVLFVVATLRLLMLQRIRAALFWMFVWIQSALILAMVSIYYTPILRVRELFPEEQYMLDGWYLPLIASSWTTGILFAMHSVWQQIRRVELSRRTRLQSARR